MGTNDWETNDRDPSHWRSSAPHVDLWSCRYEDIEDPNLWRAYASLMSPDERARHDRFHFAGDRRQFLATRALVRTTLSRYVPSVAPADWRFDRGPAGRPVIAGTVATGPVHFNLSHTAGLIVCAVSRVIERLGVDVEAPNRRRLSPLALADRFFAPAEVRALRALPDEAAVQRGFFTLWTLKESYMKARGLGLSLGLESFAFDPWADPAAILFTPPADDRAAPWRFAAITTPSDHVIAVSAKTCGGALILRTAQVVPGLT